MSLHKRYSISPAVVQATLKDNVRFSQYLLYVLLGIVGALIIYNLVITSIRHIRTLTCLNNDTQRFFKAPQPLYAKIKQHLLYAPLFSRRHSKQVRVGPMDLGILPTRLQSLLFLSIIIMNVILATFGMEWSGTNTTLIMHFRNRVGLLAVTNMIPLVIIAGRNNPFIHLTSISFDTWNLVHRWLGHIIIALAVAHSSCELYYMDILAKQMHKPSLTAFNEFVNEERFLMFGFVSWIAMMAIFLTTFTSFRHAFYETFLHIHIALVALVLAGLWIHLDDLPSQGLVKVTVSIWVVERLIRLAKLMYRNVGRTSTQATVEALPGDAMRVTLRLARPWTFKPGQHIFLTLPSVGLWTNHPFSVAWSDTIPRSGDPEKGLAKLDSHILFSAQTSVSLVIRKRGGFTSRLYDKASKTPAGLTAIPAFIEGPYGGSHVLQSYGTVIMFAGGIGITHCVPFVRDLVSGYASGTVAARRVLLVWVIRSPEHLEWIRPWMTSILSMHKRRDVLRVQLFVTRPRSSKEIHSPSSTVQMFPGKPNVETVVEMESRNQVGAMGVCVCGPGGLGDDVRAAVRRRQGRRNIDLLEESFGW